MGCRARESYRGNQQHWSGHVPDLDLPDLVPVAAPADETAMTGFHGAAGWLGFSQLRSTIRRTRAGRRWGRVRDVDLWQRSLGFAALGFLTLVPLLIVVSAADTATGQGFAQWLGDGLGVSPAARAEIERLFALPGEAWRTTTAFGLALLAVFGLSFGTVLQSGYERIWDLPPARWWARWRHALWLGALIAVLYLSAITPLWRESPARGSSRSRSAPCSSGGPSGCCSAAGWRGSLCFPERWPPCSDCSDSESSPGSSSHR